MALEAASTGVQILEKICSEDVEDLPSTVLAIIGMSEMGFVDYREIAYYVFQRLKTNAVTEDMVSLVRRVLTSEHELISVLLDYGLPAGFSAFIHTPVRCDSCKALVRMVPCVRCYMLDKWTTKETEGENGPRYVALRPGSPTVFEPGSEEKKELMSRRVRRGESPFHPDDVIGDDTPENIRMAVLSLASIFAASNDRSNAESTC